MNTQAAIEGILFAMGNPVKKSALAEALEVTEAEIDEAIERLRETYQAEERGLQVISLEDSYQLCTKKECYEPLIRLAARPRKPVLTNVLLETLAIIAYKQPVTKMEIAKIRGVNSDHAVNKLVEYELVCEAGRLDAPGRPILFVTTEEFLRRFQLPGVDAMPELDAEKLAEIAEEVERETAALETVPV